MHEAQARITQILLDESIDYEQATQEVVELIWRRDVQEDHTCPYISDWTTLTDQVLVAWCNGNGTPVLTIYIKEQLYDLFHDALDEYRSDTWKHNERGYTRIDMFIDFVREGLEDCEYRANQIVEKID